MLTCQCIPKISFSPSNILFTPLIAFKYPSVIQDNHCHGRANCSTTNNVILGPFAVFDDFHVTQEEGSWIGMGLTFKECIVIFFMTFLASSWVLGHLVSAVFAGFVSDAIGRKKSLLLDTAVFFLGFVMLATGHLPACLIIGRLLLGYPLVSQVRSGY